MELIRFRIVLRVNMPYAKAKMKTSDRPDRDRISDLPSNVISNILERLPLCEAVRTSALSKQWRMHWVSMSELIFDHKFFGDAYRWRPQDMSSIEMLIGKILLHHHGTAASVTFLQDSLGILIANCPLLVSLHLSRCDGVNFIGDSQNLAYIYIDTGTLNSTAGSQQDMKCNVIDGLTTLCKIEILRFRGDIYKFLAASGLDKPFRLTFSNIKILSLHGVDFSEQLQFSFALKFIQSCPYIQELSIQAATPLGTNTVGHNFDTVWNSSCKMGNLQTVCFCNIMGLHSELKLIQNLLASVPKLKKFYISAKKRFSDHQKSRVLMKLMKFCRASLEAQLKYIDPPSCF
ncbi:hypothetical protein Cgig2_018401 [Carnegiea gigantea]|uniref:F-box domain-containing protein n=1 Tax=Carnegiea gigantea TaxID=171969 RepID=A0A9Q1GN26_9CARY|nr:hypothetical protein Cgig2_018401 [Carnegiea gigantea]